MQPFETDGTDREKRWMVLAANGQHSWLGRHSDPSEGELRAVSLRSAELGLDSWLCLAEGDYWSHGYYGVLQVKSLNGRGDFNAALTAFMTKRLEALKTL